MKSLIGDCFRCRKPKFKRDHAKPDQGRKGNTSIELPVKTSSELDVELGARKPIPAPRYTRAKIPIYNGLHFDSSLPSAYFPPFPNHGPRSFSHQPSLYSEGELESDVYVCSVAEHNDRYQNISAPLQETNCDVAVDCTMEWLKPVDEHPEEQQTPNSSPQRHPAVEEQQLQNASPQRPPAVEEQQLQNASPQRPPAVEEQQLHKASTAIPQQRPVPADEHELQHVIPDTLDKRHAEAQRLQQVRFPTPQRLQATEEQHLQNALPTTSQTIKEPQAQISTPIALTVISPKPTMPKKLKYPADAVNIPTSHNNASNKTQMSQGSELETSIGTLVSSGTVTPHRRGTLLESPPSRPPSGSPSGSPSGPACQSSEVLQSESSPLGGGESDADELIPHLARAEEFSPEEYNPIPEEIVAIITRLSIRSQVECGAIYQAPDDWRELQIIGMRAKEIKDDIEREIVRFPGFSVSVIEVSDPRHHKECSGTGDYNVTKYTIEFQQNGETVRRWVNTGYNATCGLILEGQLNRDFFPAVAYFAVLPAHFGVDPAQYEPLLVINPENIELARQEAEGKSSSCHYVLNLDNSNKKRDMMSFPYFTYRHHQPPVENRKEQKPLPTYLKFASDFLLLQLDPLLPYEERSRGQALIQMSDICRSMKARLGLPHAIPTGSFQQHEVVLDSIFPLRNPLTLAKMASRNVRVFIGPYTAIGYMIVGGVPIHSDGRLYAFRIEFVLQQGRLMHGHCGSILYVQDVRTRRMYPFGKFIGISERKHKCHRVVYEAVVLQPCIDDIQASYGHLISNLKPIGMPLAIYEDGSVLANFLNRGSSQTTSDAVLQNKNASSNESFATDRQTDSAIGLSLAFPDLQVGKRRPTE